jgi:hypothetical protein
MIRMKTAVVLAVAAILVLSGGARALAGGGVLLDKKDKLTDDDKGYKPGKGTDKIDVPAAEQIFKIITDAKHKVYPMKLKKGEKVVIEMHSDDMDSVVVVEDAKMHVLAMNDDDPDGGGTLDSRLQFTAAADGQYRIIATNLNRKTGDFTLKVTKAK